MAKNVRYFVRDVLEFMYENLQGICEEQLNSDGEPLETVYTSHRPAVVENHSEFLVSYLSKSVYSHGPFQNAAAYVDIVVRNGQGGIERTYRLQEILDELCERFPMTKYDEEDASKWRFIMKEPRLVISGDDQLGFTVWRLRASVVVNTTDRYYL